MFIDKNIIDFIFKHVKKIKNSYSSNKKIRNLLQNYKLNYC